MFTYIRIDGASCGCSVALERTIDIAKGICCRVLLRAFETTMRLMLITYSAFSADAVRIGLDWIDLT
jgi:hypothetical protein